METAQADEGSTRRRIHGAIRWTQRNDRSLQCLNVTRLARAPLLDADQLLHNWPGLCKTWSLYGKSQSDFSRKSQASVRMTSHCPCSRAFATGVRHRILASKSAVLSADAPTSSSSSSARMAPLDDVVPRGRATVVRFAGHWSVIELPPISRRKSLPMTTGNCPEPLASCRPSCYQISAGLGFHLIETTKRSTHSK